jgi:septum formation protein
VSGDSIILASASPRRHRLLALLGMEFSIVVSTVDELKLEADGPVNFAEIAAEAKCREVAARSPEDACVIGADTVVHFDGASGKEIFGKPTSPREARHMLRRLSGRVHQVTTGIALRFGGETDPIVCSDTTDVRFRPLRAEEITSYVETGESLDKAGAYAVQGVGGDFIAEVKGDLQNVIGLPLGLLVEMLRPNFPDIQLPEPAVLATTCRREFL